MKPQSVRTIVRRLLELQRYWSPERPFGEAYNASVQYLRRTQGAAPHLSDGPEIPSDPRSSLEGITPEHAARALQVATEIVNYTTTEDIAGISVEMYARYCMDMPADTPLLDTRYFTPISTRRVRPAKPRKPDQ